MKLIDRTGVKYGHTLVVRRAPNKSVSDTNARWWCQCDCGNMHIAYGNDLGRDKSSHCGCLRKMPKGINQTHGMSRTRVYRIWGGMKSRCENPNNPKYPRYGGKGLKFCERWKRFENFLSDMGNPTGHLTLDRIDNLQGYSPENCRWATQQAQAINRRNVKILTHNGLSLSISEWARKLGISGSTMHNRVTAGFPPEKLFAENLKHKSYRLKYSDDLLLN